MGKTDFCKKDVMTGVKSHFDQIVLHFTFVSVSSLFCFTHLAYMATESIGNRAYKRKQQQEK